MATSTYVPATAFTSAKGALYDAAAVVLKLGEKLCQSQPAFKHDTHAFLATGHVADMVTAMGGIMAACELEKEGSSSSIDAALYEIEELCQTVLNITKLVRMGAHTANAEVVPTVQAATSTAKRFSEGEVDQVVTYAIEGTIKLYPGDVAGPAPPAPAAEKGDEGLVKPTDDLAPPLCSLSGQVPDLPGDAAAARQLEEDLGVPAVGPSEPAIVSLETAEAASSDAACSSGCEPALLECTSETSSAASSPMKAAASPTMAVPRAQSGAPQPHCCDAAATAHEVFETPPPTAAPPPAAAEAAVPVNDGGSVAAATPAPDGPMDFFGTVLHVPNKPADQVDPKSAKVSVKRRRSKKPKRTLLKTVPPPNV